MRAFGEGLGRGWEQNPLWCLPVEVWVGVGLAGTVDYRKGSRERHKLRKVNDQDDF